MPRRRAHASAGVRASASRNWSAKWCGRTTVQPKRTTWRRDMDTAYSNARSNSIHPHSRVYVAGHRGMVGSALLRALHARGYANVVVRTHRELDLTNQAAVTRFMEQVEPDYIFLAAAKVRGILANNTYRRDFIYQNLVIESNVIHAAMRAGVRD